MRTLVKVGKERKLINIDLIDNLLKMEIDFGNYPEFQKEYEAFKKLSREEQLKAFDKSSSLRALAISMFPVSVISAGDSEKAKELKMLEEMEYVGLTDKQKEFMRLVTGLLNGEYILNKESLAIVTKLFNDVIEVNPQDTELKKLFSEILKTLEEDAKKQS